MRLSGCVKSSTCLVQRAVRVRLTAPVQPCDAHAAAAGIGERMGGDADGRPASRYVANCGSSLTRSFRYSLNLRSTPRDPKDVER